MYIRNNFVHLYIIGIAAIAKKKKKDNALCYRGRRRKIFSSKTALTGRMM